MKLFLSLALLPRFCFCPTACADGVREGLSLAAVQALPALFPFFVVSGLLVRCDTARLSPLLAKPLARLYGLPPEAAPALVLGLIGGYRSAPRPHVRCFLEGVLSREAAERVNRFCNCASPLLHRTGWSRRVRLRAGRCARCCTGYISFRHRSSDCVSRAPVIARLVAAHP